MKTEVSPLKTLGLIGGMSWESTVPYYQLINQAVQAQLGGLHSAKVILYSVDFAEMEHDAITQAVNIPLLHIADPTALAIQQAGLKTVGLLGTRFTMEQDFYRARLEQQHGLTVLTPPDAERAQVHRIIYDELCRGQVQAASRQTYQQVITNLQAQGAQAIILGCTEIAMLIRPQDCAVPLFDTTALHAEHAARWALR